MNIAWQEKYADILSESSFLRDFAHQTGNTPLISVPSPNPNVQILAKCEWFNPCGSVKDRTALILLLDHLKNVKNNNRTSKTILEYSGGNLALSLAHICRGIDLDLHLVLSQATSSQITEKIRSLGVRFSMVDKDLGFLGVMRSAENLAASGKYEFFYQHENDLNWRFHSWTTGEEILAQFSGKIDFWVASVGTGGTFAGVLHSLKMIHSQIKGIVVTPSELPYGSKAIPNGLPKYAGAGGLGFGIRQRFVAACEASISGYETVSYAKTLQVAAELYAQIGLRVGTSAAANYHASRVQALNMKEGVIVTIFPCRGTDSDWEKIKQIL